MSETDPTSAGKFSSQLSKNEACGICVLGWWWLIVGPLAVGGVEWMGVAGDRWSDLLLQAVLRATTRQNVMGVA